MAENQPAWFLDFWKTIHFVTLDLKKKKKKKKSSDDLPNQPTNQPPKQPTQSSLTPLGFDTFVRKLGIVGNNCFIS